MGLYHLVPPLRHAPDDATAQPLGVFVMATTYRDLLAALYNAPPTSYARMQPAGSSKKYLKIYHPLTERIGELHWNAKITVAAPLTGADGLSKVAAADFDHGGAAAICDTICAATTLGFRAIGMVATGGVDGHDGGHVWLLFDQATEPPRLRAVMRRVTEQAKRQTYELYPSGKALRLPFGRHTWTGQRGMMCLPNGQRFDLDEHLQCQAALEAFLALPRNPISLVPVLQSPQRRNAPQTRPDAPRTTATVIEDYNQRTDLVALLERYGARIAETWPSGALLHCPCPGHQHCDQRPSLEIKESTKTRNGSWVAVGYAPTCWFFTEPGQVVNAFTVLCRLEHWTASEAVKRLAVQSHICTDNRIFITNDYQHPSSCSVADEKGQR